MKTIKVPANKKSEIMITKLEDLKVELGNNSELTVISIQDSPVKSKIIRKSIVGKGANLKWVDYWLGGSVNLDAEDNLDGKGASVNRVGIFVGTSDEDFNSVIQVNHNAPETNSDIQTRGILDGKAKAIAKDTIFVKNKAKNSIGKQKADILLLSNDAFADASPQLEINEEEVTCSHGAAIGRVNPERLFYLMSRGLSEKEAKKQVVEAFFEPTFAEIRNEDAICALKNKVLEVVI